MWLIATFGGNTGDGSKINRRQYRELFSPEGNNTYLNDIKFTYISNILFQCKQILQLP